MRLLVTGGAGYIGSVVSSARIGEELGWSPHKPALDDMIGDAWACLQGHQGDRV